jgi:hypothetical protein
LSPVRVAARPGLWLDAAERRRAVALAELVWCNPFLPRRVELEREVLGEAFVAAGAVWHKASPGADPAESPNWPRIAERTEQLVAALHDRIAAGARLGGEDAVLYRDLVFYLLYQRYAEDLFLLLPEAHRPAPSGHFTHWGELQGALSRLLHPVADLLPGPGTGVDAAHLIACFFQVRRAFHFLHHFLLGASAGAARLRAEAWHSIFGHDMRRYQRSLWAQLADIPTLVTGPSGSGKELVARAIALSRYAPFSPSERTFAIDLDACFFPLNLGALPATLVESELFGHRRGSFTGAVEDRTGWLELCPPTGTVFLDEIGDVEPALQVKLLRVVEARAFQRLGEARPRRFTGKLVAATHRDLAAAMRDGRFREDLYYRLCGDMVRTPSLAERLHDSPGELALLVAHLAHQLVGPEEAPAIADETVAWIERSLPTDYPGPGNVRELGQCLRNVLLRREYHPGGEVAAGGRAALAAEVEAGRLTLQQLARRYTTLVYARSGSYLEAARRLGLDRRTVRSYVDEDLLAELRGGVRRAPPDEEEEPSAGEVKAPGP